VVATIAVGRVTKEMALLVTESLEQHVSQTGIRVSIFHEWGQVQTYEAAVRTIFVNWGLKHLRRYEGIHFLVGQNHLLNMGVRVGAMVVPSVHSYAERKDFLAAYSQVVAHLQR